MKDWAKCRDFSIYVRAGLACAVGLRYAKIAAYESTPGVAATVKSSWPVNSQLHRDTRRLRLSCSPSTVPVYAWTINELDP